MAETGAGDRQQGELPEMVPETGAGGLASGGAISVGNAVAVLVMLVGGGYAVRRRR